MIFLFFSLLLGLWALLSSWFVEIKKNVISPKGSWERKSKMVQAAKKRRTKRRTKGQKDKKEGKEEIVITSSDQTF